MKQEQNCNEPITLSNIVAWTFAALFSLSGIIFYPLVGWCMFGLVSIISCVLVYKAKIVHYTNWKFWWNDQKMANEYILPHFFICTGLVVTLYGIFSHTGWAFVVCILYMAVVFGTIKEGDNDGLVSVFLLYGLFIAVACICIFMYTNLSYKPVRIQSTYTKTESIMDAYNEEISCGLFTDAQKKELQQNTNGIKAVLKQCDTDAKLSCSQKDSLFGVFASLKRGDFEKIHRQFRGKTEVLTVKRVWLNGDALPWTYDAWTRLNLRTNSYPYLMGLGGIGYRYGISLEMKGKASYTGDTRLNYVNVVLSDNSFTQFDIAKNPQWLMVRKGDKVEVTYLPKKDNGIHMSLIADAEKPDMLYDKVKKPLFK